MQLWSAVIQVKSLSREKKKSRPARFTRMTFAFVCLHLFPFENANVTRHFQADWSRDPVRHIRQLVNAKSVSITLFLCNMSEKTLHESLIIF